MKNFLLLSITTVFVCTVTLPLTAEAGCSYNGYINSSGTCAKSWHKKNGQSYQKIEFKSQTRSSSNQYIRTINSEDDLEDYIDNLLKLIEELRDRRDKLNDDDDNDEKPDVTTNSATNIEDDEAKLRGRVDMNDFNNGQAFFVYGEDEDDIEDATDEDKYNDIDQDSDNLQKVIFDNDIDNTGSYEERVRGLDDDTRHYFALCVEYEDEDDDKTLECGAVREFVTDN